MGPPGQDCQLPCSNFLFIISDVEKEELLALLECRRS